MSDLSFAKLGAGLLCVAAIMPLPAWGQDRDTGRDDESKKRLIRKTKGESVDDVMARIIDHMDQTGRRLSNVFDVGSITQQIQRQIIKELDLAIKQAKQNMRLARSPAQQRGEKREEGETSDESQTDDDQGRSGSDASDQTTPGRDGDEVEVGTGGGLRESRRQWGHLPPRDRDQILQSFDEDAHEKYRKQIERYYEALADRYYEALADPEFDQ